MKSKNTKLDSNYRKLDGKIDTYKYRKLDGKITN